MSSLIERAIPGFEGEVLVPGDPGYDEARKIWNGMIDRRPGVIARCSSPADVVAAVRFGREKDLLISVRGGGHNVSGNAVCDDGLMIDLSLMKGILVDPKHRSAVAQPGLTLKEFHLETQSHGLATTLGVNSDTGIAGLTLGGGIGWLMGKFGLTCDNLLAAEVVTADGELVRASDKENPDLLWGLKGGGGNFGIVTSFEYQMHELGPLVFSGVVVYRAERAAEVMRFYRDFIATAPEELGTVLNLRRAAPLPIIPYHLHGVPVIQVAACYAGPPDEGERVLRPLREFGPPELDLFTVKPYITHQGMFDATVPKGWRYYWKSQRIPPLTDSAIDTICEHAFELRSPKSYTIIFNPSGAVTRVSEDATAFSGRTTGHEVNINAVMEAHDPDDTEWCRGFFQALQSHGTGGVYVNFLMVEGEDRVRSAYGPEKYDRLAALKARWDRDNMFRMNQNIKPKA